MLLDREALLRHRGQSLVDFLLLLLSLLLQIIPFTFPIALVIIIAQFRQILLIINNLNPQRTTGTRGNIFPIPKFLQRDGEFIPAGTRVGVDLGGGVVVEVFEFYFFIDGHNLAIGRLFSIAEDDILGVLIQRISRGACF